MARKLSIIVLVLVLLYALLGFVALPWWLERAIPERLAQHMGWQATIEEVAVNPFAMSIEALGLAADDSDGESVLAFDRLYINVGILRLATGIIAFQNLELASPYARVDLRDDYSVNFGRDWQANNPASEAQADAQADAASSTPSGPDDPLKVFVDQLRITGGEVLFRDFSQAGAEPKEFEITPLDLSLNDLATWPREDRESDYYLEAAIGSQTLQWEGNLSVAPFASSGYLSVANVSHDTLAHFLGPYLPYALRDGTLSVSSDYQVRSGEQFALATAGGEVKIENAALALDQGSETDVLKAGTITLPDIAFSLIGRELSVGKVKLDDIQLALARDSQGMLNVMQPLGGDDTAPSEEADAAESDAAPFRWSMDGVELSNARVNWLDNQTATPADLTVQQLNLTVGRLSDQLGEPVKYETALALASGGRVSLSGQTTLQPFTLEAGIGVTDLNLVQFDSYVGDATNARIHDGLLSVDGNLNLDNQTSPLTGTFSGTGQIASLDARLADSGTPLMAWQNLRLEPLEYNIAPARLEIGTLTLSNPNVNVIREQDGQHNLARIVPAADKGAEAGSADASDTEEATEADGEGFIFRIGQILLESGEVSYADRTLEPVFSTRLDQLNGSVSGLSNVPPQQAQVAIQGRVGDVASMQFDGSIGTLGAEGQSNLKLRIDDVSLPELSPYLSRYLGYEIAGGKLDVNLDYTLAGSKIDAGNRILLDQVVLGSNVNSEQAVQAPVKLGLALLTNRKGIIDIDLPIEGDLDDPEFRIAPVVVRTFVNLIAKAATSPFSMLGSLADLTGLTGEELAYVSFQPGQVALGSEDQEKLKVLSGLLEERPSLLLRLRGAVSPEVDGEFLRRQRLAEQLAISEVPSPDDRIERLESRYQRAGFDQSLSVYRQARADAQGAELDDLAWERALVERLLTTVELPPETLADLARQRGVWLKTTLQEEFDVPGDQLFLLEPLQQAAQDDNGRVKVNFDLEAR